MKDNLDQESSVRTGGTPAIELVVHKPQISPGRILLADLASISHAWNDSLARVVHLQMGYPGRARLRKEAKELVQLEAKEIRSGSGVLVLEPRHIDARKVLDESPAVVAAQEIISAISSYLTKGSWPRYLPAIVRNSIARLVELGSSESLEIRIAGRESQSCKITESTGSALGEPEVFDLESEVVVIGRIFALNKSIGELRIDTGHHKIRAMFESDLFEAIDNLRWKKVKVSGFPRDPSCRKMRVSAEPIEADEDDADGIFLNEEAQEIALSKSFGVAQVYFERIGSLQDNWDSYGAKKPARSVLDFASAFFGGAVSVLADRGVFLPPPFITPTFGGGIQFEFAYLDRELELEIEAPNYFRYLKIDSGVEEEGVIEGRWPANRLLSRLMAGGVGDSPK